TKIPVFVILNKYDLVGNDGVNVLFEYWTSQLPNAKVFPVSALEKIHTRELLDQIIRMLPESPPYFPKDDISDRTMRFFVSEIIREKIFMNYDKEIPYASEVHIEEYLEEPDIVRISALILVERESQKRIVIGLQGSMLKRVGTQARKDMESFIGKKIFLKTHVKVDENWRQDERKLKNFGYIE
ncbi:MAG: GTPase Era, partial [Flavobacteriales bacterium]